MAYYNSTNAATQSQGMNEKDEEEEKKNSLQPVSLTQGSTAGTSSGATTAPVGQAQPKAQAKSATSGMGPGFSAFTKANMGTAQNRLNQASAQNVQVQGQAAKTGINQATNQFNQRVDQGTLANRDKATQDVASAIAAIRNPQTQQPQQTEGQQAPTAPAPTQGAPTAEQTSRFQEIINAKYQGPESLRQSGLYDLASKRVQKAQNTVNQTQTAGGREEMLRNMFQKQGNYTQGLNKLDSSLLNSSQSGVQGLQNAAKAQGNLGQSLDQAQLNSVNLAGNRAKEIANIRDQSRDIFKNERTAEENATEQRIDSLVKTPVMDANGQPVLKQDGTPMTEWDRLPEHFRQSLANKAQGAKSVQQEMINSANQAYGVSNQQLQQSQAKLNDLNSQRAKLQEQLNLGKELAGFVDSRNKASHSQSLIDTQNQLNALDSSIGAETQNSQAIQATPEYQQYQQQIQQANNMNMNQWILSPEEAALLGVQSGEGLYNTQASDIKTTQAERDRLISKDEFNRQQALARLAELDQSNALQKDLMYTDESRAGTQTLNDSLDRAAFGEQLNQAEQGFRDYATNANITGYGSKKNKSSGKRYYAEETANLGNVLKDSGYNFDAPMIDRTNTANIADIARGRTSRDEDNYGPTGEITNPYSDNTSMSGKVGTAIGDYAAGGVLTRALGINNPVANVLSSAFGTGGASSKVSKSIASSLAGADLQAKLKAALDSAGFENRANIADTDSTRARTAALQALLNRKG